MFSSKGSDQALFGSSARRLGVQESAGCIADDDGSGTQWGNFQVIGGGGEALDFCLFRSQVQITGQ